MSTLHISEKTHHGMLPQSHALETESADNPRVGTKRGSVAGESPHTGVQHGRGEIENGLTNPPQRHRLFSNGQGERGREAPQYVTPRVGVVDKNGVPLDPCHPARARKLISQGRAVVVHHSPFVIRLKDRLIADSEVEGVEVGIDPGSRYTGVSLFRVDANGARRGVFAVQINHRGRQISENLASRAGYRKGRRSPNLRYRQPRFNNRTKPTGWLAPSIQHRVDSVVNWNDRLARWFPVQAIHQELVRFDMQQLDNPEITGVQYQHGTLAGTEVREYLLLKWGYRCAYCPASGVGANSVALNIDHLHPRARGGTNRVANLVLACVECNRKKGARRVEEFLAHNPTRLRRVLAQAKAPLKDAAAVNATRWALYHALGADGLVVNVGTGGQTKWNRTNHHLPKSHTLDATCVGRDAAIESVVSTIYVATSSGRGRYQRTKPNAFGFARLRLTRTKRHFGFATGDLVRAVVSKGKNAGVHVGRVAVRTSGSFNINVGDRTIQGINHKHCRLVQRADGWSYQQQKELRHVA